ncbi:MAG: hypothetical protein BYD32DRAFT_399092 [Podila humilis]|nr:MAG: hypothetical protein BYD32DRAFT_399092 [Podila humilis]
MSRPSVRETIAAARARMANNQAQSKTIRGGAADEREAFMSSGVPGVRRTTPAARRQTDVEVLGHVQKSIKSLIANAKGTGIVNISSRDLTEVPHEIWNMYTVDPDKVVIDFNATGTAWYDAVDLTRLIAADNKITFIGTRIQEFGALTVVDFHGNELTDLPEEIGQLGRLATLNLSSNKFTKLPEVLFTLTTLLELQLANNQLSGTLDPAIGRLNKVESLDLTGNQLTDLPPELVQLKSMRKLKLSKNKLTSLPVAVLAKMPKLIELEVSDNRMACLFSGLGELSGEGLNLPALVRLDARNTGLQRITDIDSSVDDTLKPAINLPAVKELLLSVNSLNNLENLLLATPQLHFLDIRNNQFTQIPLGVLDLATLRHLDMTSNHMEHIPTELGSMYDLTTFDWAGNPVRNVPRTCTTTDALMKLLRQRQENDFPTPTDTARVEALAVTGNQPDTPPSSRPSQTPVLERSSTPVLAEAQAVSVANSLSPKKPTRPVKNLNLTKKMLKDVTVEEIMTECCEPQIAILDFNLLTSFPIALHHAFGTTTLTQISIHHNKISEFPLQLSFPFLVSLNLSDNLITTLSGSDGSDESATIGANFPKLNELQISGNKLTEIPVWMPKAFPALQSLNASRNKITALDPVSFTGLQFLDLSSNDIGSLPPLLGNVRTIKSLNLDGNLFRVPRRQVMEQGTEAIMEYLRDRIPA